MITVTIPVHPLTQKVLLAQYGQQPFILENHDPLFDLLSGSRITTPSGRAASTLTTKVDFLVCDELARHMAKCGAAIGIKLYRHHKHQLCWYAVAASRRNDKTAARIAIADWLAIHGVTEDDYGLDSAYKLWQRFGWNFKNKNARFLGHLKGKTGVKTTKKTRTVPNSKLFTNPLTFTLSNKDCELAASRFLTSYESQFKRMPKVLPNHARFYAYIELQGMSAREAAEKLHLPKSTGIHYAMRMRRRIESNPTIKHLWTAALGLPEPV